MTAAMGIESIADIKANQVFRRQKDDEVLSLEEVYY
jgi:hypothetical protein